MRSHRSCVALVLVAKTSLPGEIASGSASIVSHHDEISLERRVSCPASVLFQGVKGIMGLLLCRLGLATASKAKAFKVPVWGQDMHLLEASVIRSLHRNIVRRLKSDEKYGGYNAIQCMMGTKTMDHLSRNGYVSQRTTGILLSSHDMTSTSALGSVSGDKRENREWEEDEDEYVSADMTLQQTHRRKASRTY